MYFKYFFLIFKYEEPVVGFESLCVHSFDNGDGRYVFVTVRLLVYGLATWLYKFVCLQANLETFAKEHTERELRI